MAAPPDMARSPVAVLSSPASAQSRSHGSPGTSSLQVAHSARSRVHFATSPASVVEITPYSWASSASSPVFESPTSPHLWMNAVHLSQPTGYPVPATQYAPCVPSQFQAPQVPSKVMLPLQAVQAQPAMVPVAVPAQGLQGPPVPPVPPMLPQQVLKGPVTSAGEWSGNAQAQSLGR